MCFRANLLFVGTLAKLRVVVKKHVPLGYQDKAGFIMAFKDLAEIEGGRHGHSRATASDIPF